MYKLITVEDAVRIPPTKFGDDIETAVMDILREQYESRIDPDVGLVLNISSTKKIGEGRIIPGDGASYHNVVFEALVFQPQLHEVVKARVSEIVQFGAFIRFGPIDGLVHISQVTDDFIAYNEKTGVLAGKDSKKVLKAGDEVLARIVTLSLKPLLTESKIGLTMRQPGLGKKEWAELKKKKKTVVKKEAKKK